MTLEEDQRVSRMIAWLLRNEGVSPDAVERAVSSARAMKPGEAVCLDGMDATLRRAFVDECLRRLR